MIIEKNGSDDYGEKLYGVPRFQELFENFEKEQNTAAQVIWERILSRCGVDTDLPPITTVVDYGCGDGTLLKKFASLAGKPDKCGMRLKFIGIDCSAKAIEMAKVENSLGCAFSVCDPCPKAALSDLSDIDWTQTALLSMSHTWFHLDQSSLINAVLEHRPALLLIDVFATWDRVIEKIRSVGDEVFEHGRRLKDGTCYLITKPAGKGKVTRGLHIFRPDGSTVEIFKTTQAAITTKELIEDVSSDKITTPSEALRAGRRGGHLADKTHLSDREVAFVRRRIVHHDSGWGRMDCHALTSRDLLAVVLNNAYFDVIKALILQSPLHGSSQQKTGVSLLLELFNEKFEDPSNRLAGSREALVLLPFDPRHTFARIVPLFEGLPSEISEHSTLLESPSLAQRHFPSANGLFQTCLSRSSSPQAFATHWAQDYILSEADIALEGLELVNFGLDKNEPMEGSDQPASYFMLPVYFGSLPLFALALKFPRTFDPKVTSFDVYFSALRSLHDSIGVLLTDDLIRREIVRPWIESVMLSPHWSENPGNTPEAKLQTLEQYIFGRLDAGSEQEQWRTFQVDGESRHGGVLGMEWKSWILGLPSIPIKKLASVEAMNKRLWDIWRQEKDVAKLDPALRISLWFQDGRFFEDSPVAEGHDYWVCSTHLQKLHTMFFNAGLNMGAHSSETDDAWIDGAVKWIKGNEAATYFGKTTQKHFLFDWLSEQLSLLVTSRNECAYKVTCDTQGDHAKCLRHERVFKNLKAVFCKSLANKGPNVRLGLHRLYCLLKAAACTLNPPPCYTDQQKLDWPDAFEAKFWSVDDPSIALAEFVHALGRMEILEEVSIEPNCTKSPKEWRLTVTLKLTEAIQCSAGGQSCDKAIAAIGRFAELAKLPVTIPNIYGSLNLIFYFHVNPNLSAVVRGS